MVVDNRATGLISVTMPARHKQVAKYTQEALADVSEYGPAMRALNPRQRGFVIAMFETNLEKPNNTDFARMAGYTGSDEALRVTAHRVAHSEKVQLAIKEEAERRTVAFLPRALGRLQDMAMDKFHKDSLAAAKHTAAIAGLAPKTHHVIEHVHDRASLITEIQGALAILEGMGVKSPRELVPIDAEFEEIEEDDNHSMEGLEDIL